MKDSLYSAIGHAAPCLEKHLDFDAFLLSTLVPEVQISQRGYNIIRRRIAILLGQWMPIKPGELDRPAVYQIFQYLLNKDDPLNDQVVRVTAGRQLKNVLDPFEFTAEGFLPYSSPILQSLMSLMQEAELIETKMALLETVRMAVVKMEDHVSFPTVCRKIVLILTYLFIDRSVCGSNRFSPPAFVGTIGRTAFDETSNTDANNGVDPFDEAKIYQIPFLDFAPYTEICRARIGKNAVFIDLKNAWTDIQQETLVYLLEESLELWSAILMQTPAPAPTPLLALFPSLFPIFDLGTECTRQALEIAESYVILAPQEFMDDNIRFRLLAFLEPLVGPNVRSSIGLVPNVAEKLIRVGESIDNGSEQVYTAIAKSFIDSSFLQSLLAGLYDAHQAHLTTGPHRKAPAVYGVTETDYFSVLARLALASPRTFFSAVTSATGSSSDVEPMTWILNEWFSHFDNIGDINRKKLHALGLTKLLSVNGVSAPPPQFLLEHLQSYLNIWTALITELAEGTEDDPVRQGDYLIYWADEPADPNELKWQETEPPQSTRERMWNITDPVRKLNIRHFVTEHLRGVVNSCGGIDSFKENWLVNVDQDVVNGFGQLGVF